jgi:putative sterol carrier protein
VAVFLSDAWLAELDAAARSATPPSDLRLVVQQVVAGDHDHDTCYGIRIEDGRISVVPGRVDDADITLTQDRITAADIAQGALSAQVAFMAGRLRVGGDLSAVMDRAGALVALGDVFAEVRDSTSGW